MEIGYAGKVLDHYENPRNVGSFAPGPAIATGLAGSPKTGVVRLQLQIEDGLIADARFKAHGCGYTIAAASYATEWVKGKSVDEVARLGHDHLATALDVPAIKLHSALLVEDAIRTALDDYGAALNATVRRRPAP